MKAACVLLQRHLDPGKTERFIQFSTARKIRSAYSNVYHSSQELSRVTVMAHKLSKTYSTECPTYGYWFEKFILGCHKRMGDVVCSDFALSKALFLELVDDLENDWDDCQDEGERFRVAGFAMVLLSTFLCGLRGEEVMKSDIAGLLKYLDIRATDIFHPHVIIALLGRLKSTLFFVNTIIFQPLFTIMQYSYLLCRQCLLLLVHSTSGFSEKRSWQFDLSSPSW
jgi:hypothetical protein